MDEHTQQASALLHKTICISSVIDPGHPHNTIRARLLELLYCEDYTILSDADGGKVSLGTIHAETVIPSDAFVLLPIPRGRGLTQAEKDLRMKELFKAASLVVGLQTDDPYMHLDPNDLSSPTKPIIIVDEINHQEDETWRAFHDMLHGLHQAGTVKAHPETLVTFVDAPEEVLPTLKAHAVQPPKIKSIANTACKARITPESQNLETCLPQERRISLRSKPDYNVCVFLSASTEDRYFIDAAFHLGALIAQEGWGLISGAGSTSMMGSIIQGAAAKGGWTGGTTMDYIARHEGIPPQLDQFWYNEDIYTRMKDMIEASDSFVIMPGGMGTVQELFTLLLLRHEQSPLMKGAEIVICNERGFWQPLIHLIDAYGFDEDVHVVNNISEVAPMLYRLKEDGSLRKTLDTPNP